MAMFGKLESFIRSHWFVLGFVTVVLISAFFRLYKIGDVPHGMTWDEAAIGYNGYAVITTRRDEWLERLPVSFRSFGDYKAPLAIYLNGFFTVVLGLQLWVVRLPFAVSGVVAVVGIIFLGKALFSGSRYVSVLSLLLGLSLAVLPWHIHFTRTGFESGLAVTFVIWGTYFFYRSLNSVKLKTVLLSLSVVLFTLSLYTYHSTKISVPLLVVFLLWFERSKIVTQLKHLIVPGIVGCVLSLPLVLNLIFEHGLERAGVTVFAQGYSIATTLSVIVTQFLIHLQPSFLLFGGTTSLRHGDGVHGVIYPTTFVLVVGVLTWTLWNMFKKKSVPMYVTRVVSIGCALIVLGILPAAVALEVPHGNRALTAVVGFLLLSILAIAELLRVASDHAHIKKMRDSRNRKTIFFQLIVGTYLLLNSMFAAEYGSYYFKTYARESADDFKDGYIDAFNYVIPYEKGSDAVQEVQTIYFTSAYGQPYIYALFARGTSPIYYHGGSLIKYIFQDSFVEGDLHRENSILVTTPKDAMPFEKATYVIYGSDRQPRFYIFDTTKIKW